MAKYASRLSGTGLGRVWDWLGLTDSASSTNKATANWARNYLRDNGIQSSFLDNLSDDELTALLYDNYSTNKNKFGIKSNEIHQSNLDSLLNDLTELEGLNLEKPDALDLSSVYADAEKDIQDSINATNALYDADLQRQTKLYNDSMYNLNDMYNRNANVILANNYRNNASLLGSVNSSLNRARQSAMEAGASAGLRLASNVNTLLSVQNKQAQTSLETSNQLAQAMLNQRQAAMSLRNDYSNVLSNDTANRASLENSRYSRTQEAKATAGQLAQQEYDNKLDNYNSNLAALRENNALADYWATNNQLNKYKSNTTNNQGY